MRAQIAAIQSEMDGTSAGNAPAEATEYAGGAEADCDYTAAADATVSDWLSANMGEMGLEDGQPATPGYAYEDNGYPGSGERRMALHYVLLGWHGSACFFVFRMQNGQPATRGFACKDSGYLPRQGRGNRDSCCWFCWHVSCAACAAVGWTQTAGSRCAYARV